MNSIYTLIFNHFQPLAQQVSRTPYADSLISDKFHIELFANPPRTDRKVGSWGVFLSFFCQGVSEPLNK